MSPDPRIEAAAKALYVDVDSKHRTADGYDEIAGKWKRGYVVAATAAVAAIDKAAIITSIEQLDALPELSVVIDSDPDVIEKHGNRWRSMNEGGEFYSSIRIGLPARVIHWGTE